MKYIGYGGETDALKKCCEKTGEWIYMKGYEDPNNKKEYDLQRCRAEARERVTVKSLREDVKRVEREHRETDLDWQRAVEA